MLHTELRWVLGALLLIGLFGCGQMGPLVMPPKEEPVKTSQTPSAAIPAPTPAANSGTSSK